MATKNLQVKVGEVLRSYRLEKGDSLKDVATRAGISAPSLADIEGGRANMTLERLERIAAAYGLDAVPAFTERKEAAHA